MRVLFVCMGNFCRSPSAEGVFRRAVAIAGDTPVEIEFDSAGTHDYHVGEAPDRRSVAAAARRGVDLTMLRARQLVGEDFRRFDLLLAMDEENLAELQRRAPRGVQAQIRLVMDFAPQSHSRVVPDPYYGDDKGFEEVLDLLEEAAAGFIAEHYKNARR